MLPYVILIAIIKCLNRKHLLGFLIISMYLDTEGLLYNLVSFQWSRFLVSLILINQLILGYNLRFNIIVNYLIMIVSFDNTYEKQGQLVILT